MFIYIIGSWNNKEIRIILPLKHVVVNARDIEGANMLPNNIGLRTEYQFVNHALVHKKSELFRMYINIHILHALFPSG